MSRLKAMPILQKIKESTLRLKDAVDACSFSEPVATVYNPLDYAWEPYALYLKKYGSRKKKILFMGMNPGPFGMAQVGVPFGEVSLVRDWMGLEAPVGKPENEHPKRPVDGFGCSRSEVSGRRLWGAFAEKFGAAENFFQEHYVVNYCPLVFMKDTGANLTPDKLPAVEMEPVYAACDQHLREVVDLLEPEWLIGVGAFAEKRAELALAGYTTKIGKILHPSPASPAANRGWAEAAVKQMKALELW